MAYDVTYDLKPRRDDPTAVGTAEFGDAVIRNVQLSQKSAVRNLPFEGESARAAAPPQS